jgi:hypothetical protein
MHPSCIDIGVRSCTVLGLLSHGIRTEIPSVCGEHRGDRVWYVEKMAGRKNLSCEVSILAVLAHDYDHGKLGQDGMWYGSDIKDVRQV